MVTSVIRILLVLFYVAGLIWTLYVYWPIGILLWIITIILLVWAINRGLIRFQ